MNTKASTQSAVERKYIVELEKEVKHLRVFREKEIARLHETQAQWLLEKEALLAKIRQLQQESKRAELHSNPNLMHIFFEKTCAAEQELQIAIKQIVNYREEVGLLKRQVSNLKAVLARCIATADEQAPNLAKILRGDVGKDVNLRKYFDGAHTLAPLRAGEIQQNLEYEVCPTETTLVNLDEIRESILEQVAQTI